MSSIPAAFTFSQASLQDYSDCPRRFRLRYIDHMDWPAVETEPVVENERRQQEGQVFHRLVQQHLLGLPADKLQQLANTPNLERWWKNWLDFRSSADFRSLTPELTLSSPIGEHRLLAKYDLVAIREEHAVIYDWKTSSRRPRNEWLSARWQTRVYRSLLVKAGAHLNGGPPFDPAQIEMIYWFADFPSEPARFQYDRGQFKRDWSAIEAVIGEISAAEDFPLTDEQEMCQFCIYRSYCNRGTRAGDGQNSEAEADAGNSFDIQFEQIEEIEF